MLEKVSKNLKNTYRMSHFMRSTEVFLSSPRIYKGKQLTGTYGNLYLTDA